MANEYIRKQDAVDMCGGYGCLAHFMSTIKPADVAPVVRCNDCRYHALFGTCSHPDGMKHAPDNGFCSYGKRREEE